MASSQLRRVIQQLRAVTLHQDGEDLSDGQLLERYVRTRDEVAFAALVRRHGPMVWAVCLRVLRNHHDAEDAFQASFLVLVRKAASVRPRAMVGNWLYGVAHQTALRAKVAAAKRRLREKQITPMPEPAMKEPDLWLDQELSRLPAKYRAVIVLCDLEGKTRRQAARQLEVPEGTVASRLATARSMLAKRLTRQGLAVSGGAPAAMLAGNAVSASVPSSVLLSTIRLASLVAAGQGAAAISAQVAALTEGVMKAMLLSKLKVAATFLLAAGIVASAASLIKLPVLAVEPPQSSNTAEAATRDEGKSQTASKPVVIHTDDFVTRLTWSPDGKVIATLGFAYGEPIQLTDHEGKNPKTFPSQINTAKLWDARTGKLKRLLSVESKISIGDIAFSPDGKTAALRVFKSPEKKLLQYSFVQKAGDPPLDRGKHEIRIVDADTWALKQIVPVDQVGFPQAFAFSPDGKTLAFGGHSSLVVGGAYVKLWDVENQKLKGGTKFAENTAHGMVMAIRDGDVGSLAFSPDGTLLAAGERLRGGVRLFDAETGEVKQVWEAAHSGPVRGVAFSPDGRFLVSISQDKTMKFWDVGSRTLWYAPTGNKGTLAAVAFAPDGKLLATCGSIKEDDKYLPEVILWDATTWKLKQTLPDQAAFTHTLAFSPDGNTLAVGGGKGGEPKKDGGKTTGEIRLIPVD